MRRVFVATLVRTIFAQPDAELTHAQHTRVVEQLQVRWPDAARLLADAADDLLAFTALPKEHWRQDLVEQSTGAAQSRAASPH